MSVHYPNAEKRAALVKEFGVNLENWAIRMEDGQVPTDNITGVLPERSDEIPTNAEGLTKTQARHKNKFEGKHRAPPHKRKPGARAKSNRATDGACSTCGRGNATILFLHHQFCSNKCIPTLGAQAAPSDQRSGIP